MYKIPIRLGILGCGSFVQRRILPILGALDNIRVVALQKRKISDAQKIADEFKIPHAFSSRDELIKHPDIDAILVATPNHMHEEDVLACARYSKPVLCEKPLAPTTQAIETMIGAFRSQSIPLFVGQSLRFKFCVQKARELLQSGRLGQLLSFRAYFSVPVAKDNWRLQKDRGGGVLQDLGVHLIDLIRFVSGREIQSVVAMANREYKAASREVEQTVTVIGRLSQYAVCSFECSFIQPFSSGFEVIGTNARLISRDSLRQSNDSLETLCLIEKDDTRIDFPIQRSNIYAEELKHFADALQGGKSSIIAAEEGLQNQKVIEAAYFSIQSGADK